MTLSGLSVVDTCGRPDLCKRSEERYRRLFETAQDGILVLDGDTGEIIDANPFILNLLGYPPDYFIGRCLWEPGFLNDTFFTKKAFAELQANGYIRCDDLPLEPKAGRPVSVEFVGNTYLEGDRKRIQCTIRDRTGRKSVPESLKISEIRYRRLFETAQDGILILDGDTGEIIDANPFILNLLGYPLDYFTGRHLWELGFLKDKSLAVNAFDRLKKEGFIRYEDLPLETHEGGVINVEFVSNAYLVGEKRIIQCNIRDITARKRSEDALALASSKLNLMSGITRHDVRNQLLILSSYLTLALRTVTDPQAIDHISRAQKAAGAIRRQIAFTKEYQDLGSRSPVWQDLAFVAGSAASLLADDSISLEIPDDHLELYADLLLVKVFYNLFDNARQHGGTVTRITLSHRISGTGLVITVADNGAGIALEDKPHLFERGFGKNTGLGLFFSKEILSITGMSIRETGIPGEGARFEIAVPEGGFRFSEQSLPEQ